MNTEKIVLLQNYSAARPYFYIYTDGSAAYAHLITRPYTDPNNTIRNSVNGNTFEKGRFYQLQGNDGLTILPIELDYTQYKRVGFFECMLDWPSNIEVSNEKCKVCEYITKISHKKDVQCPACGGLNG